MTKRKNCKICEEYSGRRNICKNCKDKYPYQSSGEGGKPFNRRELYEKDMRKQK